MKGKHLRHTSEVTEGAKAGSSRRIFVIAALVVSFVLLGVGGTLVWLLVYQGGPSGLPFFATVQSPTSDWGRQPTPEEQRVYDAIKAGGDPDDPDIAYLPTPLVATCGGSGAPPSASTPSAPAPPSQLLIHSPICVTHITEVEYHQASYDWALPLNPLLALVEVEAVMENHGTHHIPASEQPFGDEAMVGEAVSTWRLDSAGPELSSVDVGAAAGTVVYAPVSGTVVKIKTYRLFGAIDDYELHIQVPGHPEWDIVVLHIDNLRVKVGDTVIGGATQIAQVRDIGEVIDNNLSNFTEPGETGNHAHVQVNNATAPGYKGLEGALNIFTAS